MPLAMPADDAMRILYFASVREAVGCDGEEVTPPADVATVAQLIGWLRGHGRDLEAALGEAAHIRVAVNQVVVDLDHPVTATDEVAFFPPVTGGAAG